MTCWRTGGGNNVKSHPMVAHLQTDSAEETERAGEISAHALGSGDVVVVTGELGVGKTTFIRGACRALEVTDPVTSPTYTIGHIYTGRIPVAHLDLFRLDSLEREDPALLLDYVTSDRVCFIECPGSREVDIEGVRLRADIAFAEDERRTITCSGDDRVVSELKALQ